MVPIDIAAISVSAQGEVVLSNDSLRILTAMAGANGPMNIPPVNPNCTNSGCTGANATCVNNGCH